MNATPQRPNVVVLMNDQHAHDALGCAGYGTQRTATADALAADGMRFRQAVCAVSPCLPSRHSLLHGLYPFQSGMLTNGTCMDPAKVPPWTLGKLFSGAGYATGAFGKMHFFPYHAPVERGSYFGFSERQGPFHETGESMDTHFVKEHHAWTEQRMAEREAHGIGLGGDDCAAAFLGYRSELKLNQRSDWWVAQRSADFVQRHASEPFFLFCSLTGPHAPHDVPADYWGRYTPDKVPPPPEWPDGLPDAGDYKRLAGLTREQTRTAIANYMASVEATDDCHALVIEALKRNGLYDSTVIVYMSDHGELLASRGASCFSKYSLYEQAIRIPLIIKPHAECAGFRPGTLNDEPVSIVDLLPTLAELSGLNVPKHLPGLSLKPALLGENDALAKREFTITQYTSHMAVRSRNWKLIRGPRGDELYDIAHDPYEFRNVSNTAAGREVLARLSGVLLQQLGTITQRYANFTQQYQSRGWSVFQE